VNVLVARVIMASFGAGLLLLGYAGKDWRAIATGAAFLLAGSVWRTEVCR
jgi:hypothetical protein